jgi:hypothetical protein
MKKLFAVIMAIVIMFGVSELKAQKEMSNPQTIGGQLVFAFPTGSLGDAVNMGIGVNFQYTYYFSPKFAAYGFLGYHSYGAKEYAWGDGTSTGIELSASVIPIGAGAFYQVGQWGKLLPIVGGELGLHMGEVEMSGAGNGYLYSASGSQTDIALAFFGGVLYPVNRELAMRGDLKYTAASNFGNFSINLGIMYKI